MKFKPKASRPNSWVVANEYGAHVAEIEANDAGVMTCVCYEGADFSAEQLHQIAAFIEENRSGGREVGL